MRAEEATTEKREWLRGKFRDDPEWLTIRKPASYISWQGFSSVEQEKARYLNVLGLFHPYPSWLQRELEEKRLEVVFQQLLEEWRNDVAHLSSVEKMAMHPAYQTIIGKGKDVIPLLLMELQEEPDHLFWALTAITEQNPIKEEDAGNIKKMADAWLEWGRREGYL